MPASSDGRMAQHGLGGYGGELDRWPGLDARRGRQPRLAQGACLLMPSLNNFWFPCRFRVAIAVVPSIRVSGIDEESVSRGGRARGGL